MSLDKKDRIKNQSLFENLTLKDAASTKVGESRARTIEANMGFKWNGKGSEVKSVAGRYSGAVNIKVKSSKGGSIDVSERGEKL